MVKIGNKTRGGHPALSWERLGIKNGDVLTNIHDNVSVIVVDAAKRKIHCCGQPDVKSLSGYCVKHHPEIGQYGTHHFSWKGKTIQQWAIDLGLYNFSK